jgi:hypothetical protein
MALIPVTTHAPTQARFGDLIQRNVLLLAIVQEKLINLKMESVTVNYHAKMDSGGELTLTHVAIVPLQEMI